jgi:hypothetical protein
VRGGVAVASKHTSFIEKIIPLVDHLNLVRQSRLSRNHSLTNSSSSRSFPAYKQMSLSTISFLEHEPQQISPAVPPPPAIIIIIR